MLALNLRTPQKCYRYNCATSLSIRLEGKECVFAEERAGRHKFLRKAGACAAAFITSDIWGAPITADWTSTPHLSKQGGW